MTYHIASEANNRVCKAVYLLLTQQCWSLLFSAFDYVHVLRIEESAEIYFILNVQIRIRNNWIDTQMTKCGLICFRKSLLIVSLIKINSQPGIVVDDIGFVSQNCQQEL